MTRRSKQEIQEISLEVSSYFCRCPGGVISVHEAMYYTTSFYRIWVPGMRLSDYHDLCDTRRYMVLGVNCRTKEGEHAKRILNRLYGIS